MAASVVTAPAAAGFAGAAVSWHELTTQISPASGANCRSATRVATGVKKRCSQCLRMGRFDVVKIPRRLLKLAKYKYIRKSH
jgi:hypothetical protein